MSIHKGGLLKLHTPHAHTHTLSERTLAIQFLKEVSCNPTYIAHQFTEKVQVLKRVSNEQ